MYGQFIRKDDTEYFYVYHLNDASNLADIIEI